MCVPKFIPTDPPQDGAPYDGAPVMLFLTDLNFNLEERHYVLSKPVKSTERHALDTLAPSWNTMDLF